MKNLEDNKDHFYDDVRKKVIMFFESLPNVVSVYLFGSIVTGKVNKESDVDIAVVTASDKSYNQFDILQMQEEISDTLHRKVDLVCLNLAPVVLRMQVFRKGIKIIDKNPQITNTLFVRTLFEYDDLMRNRAPIEAKILKGRVYG